MGRWHGGNVTRYQGKREEVERKRGKESIDEGRKIGSEKEKNGGAGGGMYRAAGEHR